MGQGKLEGKDLHNSLNGQFGAFVQMIAAIDSGAVDSIEDLRDYSIFNLEKINEKMKELEAELGETV